MNEELRLDALLDAYFARLFYAQLIDAEMLAQCAAASGKSYGAECAELAACADEAVLQRFIATAVQASTDVGAALRPMQSFYKVGYYDGGRHATVAEFLLGYLQRLTHPAETYVLLAEALQRRESQRFLSQEERDIAMRHSLLVAAFLATDRRKTVRKYAESAAALLRSTREQVGEERLLAYQKALQCNLTPKCICRIKQELLEVLGAGAQAFPVRFQAPEQHFDPNILITSSFTTRSIYKLQMYREFGYDCGFSQVQRQRQSVRSILTYLGLQSTADAEQSAVLDPNPEFVGTMLRCIEQKAKELQDQFSSARTKAQHRNLGKALHLMLEAHETLLHFAKLGYNEEADESIAAVYAYLGVRLGEENCAAKQQALKRLIESIEGRIAQLEHEIARNDANLSACTAGEAEECFSSTEIEAKCQILLTLTDQTGPSHAQNADLAPFQQLLQPLCAHAQASKAFSQISSQQLDECVGEHFALLCDLVHTVCYLVYAVGPENNAPCSPAVAQLFGFFRQQSSQQELKNALNMPNTYINPKYVPLLSVHTAPQELKLQGVQGRCDAACLRVTAELREQLKDFEVSVRESVHSHCKGLIAPRFEGLIAAERGITQILAFYPAASAFKANHERLGGIKRDMLAIHPEYAVFIPRELVSLVYLVQSRLIDEDFLFPTEQKDAGAGKSQYDPRLQAYESRLELLNTRCAQEYLFRLSFLEAPQIALVQEDVFERLTITLELMSDLRYVWRESTRLAKETLEQLEITRQRAYRYATYAAAFEKQYPNYNPEVEAVQAAAALLDIFAICDSYIFYIYTGNLQPVQLSAATNLGNYQFQVIYSQFVKLQTKVLRFADCYWEDIRNHVYEAQQGVFQVKKNALTEIFAIVQRIQAESHQYNYDAFVAAIQNFLYNAAARAAATLPDLKVIIGKSCSIVPYGFRELLKSISESVNCVFSGAAAAMRVGSAVQQMHVLWSRLQPIFAQTEDLLKQKTDCPRWLLAEAKEELCALLERFRVCIVDGYDSRKQEVEAQIQALARTCEQELHCAAAVQEQNSFASGHSLEINRLILKIRDTQKEPWEDIVNGMVGHFIYQYNVLTRRLLAAEQRTEEKTKENSLDALEFQRFVLYDAESVPYSVTAVVECLNKVQSASENLFSALLKYQKRCLEYETYFSQRPATDTDLEYIMYITELEKYQDKLGEALYRFLLRPLYITQALDGLRLRAQAYYAQRSENMSVAYKQAHSAAEALLKASPLAEFTFYRPSRAKCAESIKDQLQEAEALNAAVKNFLSKLGEAVENYDYFYNADNIKEAAAHFASFSAKNYGLLRQSAGEIARSLSSVLDIENRRQNEAKFEAFAKKAENGLQQLVYQLDSVFDEITVFCGPMRCCGACTGIEEFLRRWDRARAEIECFSLKYRSALQNCRDFKLLYLFAGALQARAKPMKVEDVDLLADFPVLALDYSGCYIAETKPRALPPRQQRTQSAQKYMYALVGVDDFQLEHLCGDLQCEFGLNRAEELTRSIFDGSSAQFAGLRLLLEQFELFNGARIQIVEYFTAQRRY